MGEGGRMRISSSTIGMESARSYTSVSGRVSRLTITSGRLLAGVSTGALSGRAADGNTGEETAGTGSRENENSGNTLTATYEEMNAKTKKFSSGNIRSTEAATVSEQLKKIRQQCINYLIELLFPERRRRSWQEEFSGSGWENGQAQSIYAPGSTSRTAVSQKTFTFSRQYYHEEMSRSFQEYYEENVNMFQVSMCDPLVINLNGNIAELSDQTFLFDLDGDGQEDEINRLTAGSGFLALDKNDDGVINDGKELFGTKSGNGFADLAAYDTDRNGFIDEGDEIWNKLKIWVMDENGESHLYSLAEKGVGAICLQNTATDFAITDENNQAKGRIRNTGFFLYENGEAGSVQHVDMTLHEQKEQEKIRQNQSKYEKWLYDMAI